MEKRDFFRRHMIFIILLIKLILTIFRCRYLCYKKNMNLLGLCIGTAIGTLTHAVLYIFIVLIVHWEEEASTASTKSSSSSSDLSNVPRFSFYSILNNREEDIEMVNFHSPTRGQESRAEMDISTHGKESDENLKIFRWRKVSTEQKGKKSSSGVIN